MNRRNLFRRAGGAAVGLLGALIGIRPKQSKALHLQEVEWGDFPIPYLEFPPGAFANTLPVTIELRNPGDEPLQFWLNNRFYVDLPEDRYKDNVCVDWVFAKEWEDRYVAQCRVCPELGQSWEVLPMKRAEEQANENPVRED